MRLLQNPIVGRDIKLMGSEPMCQCSDGPKLLTVV